MLVRANIRNLICFPEHTTILQYKCYYGAIPENIKRAGYAWYRIYEITWMKIRGFTTVPKASQLTQYMTNSKVGLYWYYDSEMYWDQRTCLHRNPLLSSPTYTAILLKIICLMLLRRLGHCPYPCIRHRGRADNPGVTPRNVNTLKMACCPLSWVRWNECTVKLFTLLFLRPKIHLILIHAHCSFLFHRFLYHHFLRSDTSFLISTFYIKISMLTGTFFPTVRACERSLELFVCIQISE